MKVQILDKDGKKAKDIDTSIFESGIRKDIIQKIVECEKIWQRYAPFYLAGMQTSASGNVKHNRHVWKSDRGKGMARVPKKQMTRKGDRFFWVGAVIPGTRGGRRAHPPKILRRDLKINKKEKIIGLKAALAMVASEKMVMEKYETLRDKKFDIKFPLVLDSSAIELKTGEFFNMLKKILGADIMRIAIQTSSIRAGRGKTRNRKHKKNQGMLLVLGNKENKKIRGIETTNAEEINVTKLASNGARLVFFSEQAIKDLERKLLDKKGDEQK